MKWHSLIILLAACNPGGPHLELDAVDGTVHPDTGALAAIPPDAAAPDAAAPSDAGSGRAVTWPGPCFTEKSLVASPTMLNRIVYAYDPSGEVRLEERRYFTAGQTNERIEHHRDARGNSIEETRDEGIDGRLDTRIYRTYDLEDRLLTEQRDDGADGDFEHAIERVYDDVERTTTVRTDSEGDGVYDFERVIFFDEHGHQLRTEDGQGRVLDDSTLTHDEQGRLLVEELRAGESDEVISRTTYTYHPSGFPHTITIGMVNGGFIRSTRNERGQTIELLWHVDRPYRLSFPRDEVGNILREENDLDDDGTVNTITVYNYACWLEAGG